MKNVKKSSLKMMLASGGDGQLYKDWFQDYFPSCLLQDSSSHLVEQGKLFNDCDEMFAGAL